MDKSIEVRLERWAGSSYHETFVNPTVENLRTTISSMASEASAMLTLTVDNRALILANSGASFTITALLPNDAALDAVADKQARSDVELQLGGQPTIWPARKVLAVAIAQAVAIEFFQSGTLLKEVEWEKQGTHE